MMNVEINDSEAMAIMRGSLPPTFQKKVTKLATQGPVARPELNAKTPKPRKPKAVAAAPAATATAT